MKAVATTSNMNVLENKQTILLTVGAIIVSVIIIVFIKHNLGRFENLIESMGVFGPFLSIILYSICAFTPFPTDPLSFINVALFGPFTAFGIIFTGNTAAAFVEFYFGRHLRQNTNSHQYLEKLPIKLQKLPIDSPYFLIAGRFLPGGYGSKIISILAGMYHVPFRTYLWTTMVANFMGTLTIVLGSFGLLSLL